MQSYAGMAAAGVRGNSLASVGIADLQIYRGEFEDAINTLQEGIAVDEANENYGAVAIKLIAIADAQLELGNNACRPRWSFWRRATPVGPWISLRN